MTKAGVDLIADLLALDPAKRIFASKALEHTWFQENPKPKPQHLMPTYPSKANGERHRHKSTPVQDDNNDHISIQNQDILQSENILQGRGFRLRY